MNRQEWVYGALAGAIGGAIGWLPAEFLAIWRPEQGSSRYLLIVLYFVLVGGCIGAAIGAADGVRSGQSQRARRGALVGAVLGMVGGALGSLPGEFAFQALQSLGLGLVGRAVGWAIVGILIGAVQGVRMLREMRERNSADAGLQRASTLGIDDVLLRETELIIEGQVRSAGFDRSLLPSSTLEQLREQAARLETQFLGDASQKVDDLIHRLAARNSHWSVRVWYESLFMAYVVFVLFRVGKNFFYDSLFNDKPFLTTDFYIPAAIFWLLWSGVLLIVFLSRLRQGLNHEIQGLAAQLVDVRLSGGLFPQLDNACRQARQQSHELARLRESVETVRESVATGTNLGTRRHP